MHKAQTTHLDSAAVPEPRAASRPRYRRPRILSRQQLEVVAATCTQPTSKPDPILCPIGPVQS